MNERSLHIIRAYLQREDVQERIRKNIQRGRSEATVTIGRAARLFDFTENKLRDWEALGLLTPLKPTGQRQYTPEELDKLAIIKELIDEGGYSPGTIPHDIDKIWASISSEQQDRAMKDGGSEVEHLHIEQRVEGAYEELFWRYYSSHILRLSLMLICEEIPGTPAGLVLPLEKPATASIRRPEDLPEIGESLIGWLGQTGSFYTFLDPVPSFEYPSDYRIFPLQSIEEDSPEYSTLIVVDRRARLVNLSDAIIETIRCLLAPLYEDVHEWRPSFNLGMRDLLDPSVNFNSGTNPIDTVLNGLANMIVRLGGRTSAGQNRWRFCCILLPKDRMLPLQQRSLIVRAQSKDAPHKVGVTCVSPNEPVISLSLRAFQSGHIIYRHQISAADTTIALREIEGPIRSAIAFPIGAENGQPLAVFYLASDEPDAFPNAAQRVVRIMSRMVEEALMTYYARQQVTQKLTDLIRHPGVVDTLFADFLSENQFMHDVEILLTGIQTQMQVRGKIAGEDRLLLTSGDMQTQAEQPSEEVVSLIGIDIDKQSSLANKYGDLMTRNLSREVGLRIQSLLRVLFKEYADCQMYHIYADRFYLLLKSTPLEQAREKAERLRQGLKGPYQIDALRISLEQPTLPDSMLVLPNITVRLGVTSYPYTKLEEILLRYPVETAVVEVRAILSLALDEALERGKNEGGNVVIAWDPSIWGFARWTPPR